jgi:hypothetical protein
VKGSSVAPIRCWLHSCLVQLVLWKEVETVLASPITIRLKAATSTDLPRAPHEGVQDVIILPSAIHQTRAHYDRTQPGLALGPGHQNLKFLGVEVGRGRWHDRRFIRMTEGYCLPLLRRGQEG